MLLSRDVTSRTFSFYYPRTRPGSDRSLIVSSTNANYDDWANLSPEDYEASKHDLVETTLDGTGQIHSRHSREARPCRGLDAADVPALHASTWKGPASARSSKGWPSAARFPQQIAGLFHAGSVGIIMSGWLGAMNYGVIVANDVDSLLAEICHLAGRRFQQRS